jgi:nicotinamide riboside transporter PnuC
MDILTIALSAISCVATVFGLLLLGNKNKHGFVIFTVSLIIQAYIFYELKNWFLLTQMFILVGFNVKNYFKWKEEELNG